MYDLVSIGDYCPRGGGINRGMRRSMNNESVIGSFKDALSWTALKSGKTFMIWKEKNSTKTCSDCGHQLEKSLSPQHRDWKCPKCHKHHQRDVNAARNGLFRTLDKLESEKKTVSCSDLPTFSNEFAGSIVSWNGLGLDVLSLPGTIPCAS